MGMFSFLFGNDKTNADMDREMREICMGEYAAALDLAIGPLADNLPKSKADSARPPELFVFSAGMVGSLLKLPSLGSQRIEELVTVAARACPMSEDLIQEAFVYCVERMNLIERSARDQNQSICKAIEFALSSWVIQKVSQEMHCDFNVIPDQNIGTIISLLKDYMDEFGKAVGKCLRMSPPKNFLTPLSW